MQHSNKLDAAQLAQFSPEAIARYAAICGREAVSGNYESHVTREAIIDAWQEHRGLANRAEAISDLTAIAINGHVAGQGRPSRGVRA